MNASMVTDAVKVLRERGEKISLRAVRGVLGKGSLQDIHPLLKDVIRDEGLSDTAEDPAPAPTALQAAQALVREADSDISKADQRLWEHQRALELLQGEIRAARERADIEGLASLLTRETAMQAVTATFEAQRRQAGQRRQAAQDELRRLEEKAANVRRHIQIAETKLAPDGFYAEYLNEYRQKLHGLEASKLEEERKLAALRCELAMLVGEA